MLFILSLIVGILVGAVGWRLAERRSWGDIIGILCAILGFMLGYALVQAIAANTTFL